MRAVDNIPNCLTEMKKIIKYQGKEQNIETNKKRLYENTLQNELFSEIIFQFTIYKMNKKFR